MNLRGLCRFAPVLVPLCALALGLSPHFARLGEAIAVSHKYWYDGLIHMYLSWERFQSLTLQHGFFDFRWFAPYQGTGTYNEPALVSGLLFGLFDLVTPGEAWAFNLAMIAILSLNALALYFLIRDAVHRPWLAAIFATVGAFSPFAWARYFHPANTCLFPGLFGVLFLQRAARDPRWRFAAPVPFLFALQLYSSLYVGMFFFVPLVILVPMAVAEAAAKRNLRPFLFRLGVGTLAALPLLAALVLSYETTRRELGTKNTYEYVSQWMKRGTGALGMKSDPACQLRAFGVVRTPAECGDEMFPGKLVTAASAVGLLGLAALALARRSGRRRRRDRLGWIGFLALGLGVALAARASWPFHLGLWLALAWPVWDPRRMLGVRSRAAVFAAAALLVTDVALNPDIELFGVSFSSVFVFFFRAVPGFDGLRSEYRIIVFLPVFLALFGALAARRLLALAPCRRGRRLRTAVLGVLTAFAILDAQPAWQDFRPAPRTDRKTAVLAAAAALPPDAVIAFIRGKGHICIRREEDEGAYWDAYIMLHGHRQISSKSTYKSPATEAIDWAAAKLRDTGQRIPWSRRLAYMFGATHLIADFGAVDRPTPIAELERSMALGRPSRALVADDHMVLFDIGAPPDTAHGPVPGAAPPGPAVPGPWGIRASQRSSGAPRAIDGDPRTVWMGGSPQQPGDYVEIRSREEHCLAGVGFSPGLDIYRLPTAFEVQVAVGERFRAAAEVRRWEVPEQLIDRPGSGLVIVPFVPARTRAVRLSVTAESPWAFAVSELVVYQGTCR